eukprot:gnl/TRDRNA2_/TRDRNA2_205242_c0_seq1.p1 gnl/TRDRNA2_/TRDRNA2_205242_c0~~gnl/TRDRNA2_/TRDRNA2_205242_c0_seq1.p1  ORF type:complete len:555 (+),score=96.36 gnl/TRDRNA2_/TRDRNA2_205242_c0_seq1:35-1666(+)
MAPSRGSDGGRAHRSQSAGPQSILMKAARAAQQALKPTGQVATGQNRAGALGKRPLMAPAGIAQDVGLRSFDSQAPRNDKRSLRQPRSASDARIGLRGAQPPIDPWLTRTRAGDIDVLPPDQQTYAKFKLKLDRFMWEANRDGGAQLRKEVERRRRQDFGPDTGDDSKPSPWKWPQLLSQKPSSLPAKEPVPEPPPGKSDAGTTATGAGSALAPAVAAATGAAPAKGTSGTESKPREANVAQPKDSKEKDKVKEKQEQPARRRLGERVAPPSMLQTGVVESKRTTPPMPPTAVRGSGHMTPPTPMSPSAVPAEDDTPGIHRPAASLAGRPTPAALGIPTGIPEDSAEFGFSPPVRRGWRPFGEGAWQVNPEKPDWLYEPAEGVYFHVPSDTLWREEKHAGAGAAGDEVRVEPAKQKGGTAVKKTMMGPCVPLEGWVRVDGTGSRDISWFVHPLCPGWMYEPDEDVYFHEETETMWRPDFEAPGYKDRLFLQRAHETVERYRDPGDAGDDADVVADISQMDAGWIKRSGFMVPPGSPVVSDDGD